MDVVQAMSHCEEWNMWKNRMKNGARGLASPADTNGSTLAEPDKQSASRPPPGAISTRKRLSRVLRRWIRKAKFPILRVVWPIRQKKGVLFIGYTNPAIGLSEDFRGLISSVADSGMPIAIHPYKTATRTHAQQPFMPELEDRRGRYDIHVIGLTPLRLPQLFDRVDPVLFRGSYIVQRVFWELAKAPAEWKQTLGGIDELWAPNRFVADAFRDIFGGPITVVPPFVNVDFAKVVGCGASGMPPGRFRFFFSFDYHSRPRRKNPLGVIEAFRKAFPDDKTDVGLVIKSVGEPTPFRQAKEEIERACAEDSRITLIHKAMSRGELLGLMQACDCYVSLHRGEGFGLGMVEAMKFGKPVIATDYSGSKDFLGEETGFPVRYTLRPLEPGEYIFGEGQVWAEPDLDHAAERMREVAGNAELRNARAEAGRILADEKYGKANVRATIEARLAEIRRLTGRDF